MNFFHLQAKVISRGSGRSAIAAAAYASCSKLYNDYDGLTHDYTKKQGCRTYGRGISTCKVTRMGKTIFLSNRKEKVVSDSIRSRKNRRLCQNIEKSKKHTLWKTKSHCCSLE